MNVVYPPSKVTLTRNSIFLAGTIDMGISDDWQSEVIESLSQHPITFLNPRRKEWDNSWEQKIENPQFREQVEWELNSMDMADLILVYFAPGSKSPISMMELGLYADTGKVVVCCPEGFWRKGNIDIVCHRKGIKQIPALDEFSEFALNFLGI